MSRRVVVVEPGQGDRVGNVEFLARTVDTPFFNLSVVVLAAGQGVEGHRHDGEDDSFLVVEGTLSVTVGEDARELQAGPGTYVLVPSGTLHALHNAGPDSVRFLNIHAPGGFDRRIGLRPRPDRRPRRKPGLAASLVLTVLVTVLTLGVAGGPATAAGLTRAKVQQIAASVLQQQAPKLSVAHAASSSRAERATSAGDADRLGGRAPDAYLDRVAFGRGPSGTYFTHKPALVVHPVTLTVPDGVRFVHVTGVSAFGSDVEGEARLYIVQDGTCDEVSYPDAAYGLTAQGASSVVIDRVLPVTPGTSTFVLCAAASTPAIALVPTLTVETVAVG